MSVLIEKDARFLGIPVATVRNLLKAWNHARLRDAQVIAVRKDVNLDPRIVIMLLDELRERGLIGAQRSETGEDRDDVTAAGEALLVAKATRRVTKSKARAVLQAFLNACVRVNARDDLPFRVEQVWLFGSLLDKDRDDVADIDIVPVFGYCAKYDFDARLARFVELTKEMGGGGIFANGGILVNILTDSYVKNRLLYGVRRHYLLAPNTIDQLLGLCCPCQLIFDHQHGGIVDGPILPRHPNSPRRPSKIPDRHEMPDFLGRRKPLRPLPADLTEPYFFGWQDMAHTGPWPQNDPSYRGIIDMKNSSHVVTDRKPVRAGVCDNEVMKALSLRNLDGRRRFAFLGCQRVYHPHRDDWDYPSFGLVIARAISESRTRLRYDLHISDGAQKGSSANPPGMNAAIWWTYLMATADIEHMLRRDHEIGLTRPIEVHLTAADKPAAIKFAARFSEYRQALIDHFRGGMECPQIVFSR